METPTHETMVRPRFALPKLPFVEDALAPVVSAETIALHHDKLHRKYVDTTNALLEQQPVAGSTLEEIMRASSGTLFNNAAQAWNHEFYWHSLAADGHRPASALMRQIVRDFGSYDRFKDQFIQAATAQFASGWAWLVKSGEGLRIMTTSNADNPLVHDIPCLLTVDVWEHAYFLDYREQRQTYLSAVVSTRLNWEFAERNFEQAK